MRLRRARSRGRPHPGARLFAVNTSLKDTDPLGGAYVGGSMMARAINPLRRTRASRVPRCHVCGIFLRASPVPKRHLSTDPCVARLTTPLHDTSSSRPTPPRTDLPPTPPVVVARLSVSPPAPRANTQLARGPQHVRAKQRPGRAFFGVHRRLSSFTTRFLLCAPSRARLNTAAVGARSSTPAMWSSYADPVVVGRHASDRPRRRPTEMTPLHATA